MKKEIRKNFKRARNIIIASLAIFVIVISIIGNNSVKNVTASEMVNPNPDVDIMVNLCSDWDGTFDEFKVALQTELARYQTAGTYKITNSAVVGSVEKTPDIRISQSGVRINTQDLTDWYVYDHYGVNGNPDSNTSPANWDNHDGRTPYYYVYCKYPHAEHAGIAMSKLATLYQNSFYTNYSEKEEYAFSLQEMIDSKFISAKNLDGYTSSNDIYLYNAANTQSHILSSVDEFGKASMTFYGYSSEAYCDYLFYPTTTTNKKTISFDIDASNVNIHSMTGAGFLINTGIDASGYIHGYIVYLKFSNNSSGTAYLYKIKDNILAETLHNGVSGITEYATAVNVNNSATSKAFTLNSTTNRAQLTVDISTNAVKVQQRDYISTSNNELSTTIIDLVDTSALSYAGYNGFGPLVKYTGHNCSRTSYFIYSDLVMTYYTDSFDALRNTQYADSAYKGQKYFINLANYDPVIPTDTNEYNEGIQRMIDGTIHYVSTVDDSKIVNSVGSSNCYYVPTEDKDDYVAKIASYIVNCTGWSESGVNVPTISKPAARFTIIGRDSNSTDTAENYSQIISIHRQHLLNKGNSVVITFNDKSFARNGATISKWEYKILNQNGQTVASKVVNSTDIDKTPPKYSIGDNSSTGVYTLSLTVTDNNGYVSTSSNITFEVVDDATKPTIEVTESNTKDKVNIKFTDAGSGVMTYRISKDTAATEKTIDLTTTSISELEGVTTLLSEMSSYEIEVDISDCTNLYIECWDECGNYSGTSSKSNNITTFTTPNATPIYTLTYLDKNNVAVESNGKFKVAKNCAAGTVRAGLTNVTSSSTTYFFTGWYTNSTCTTPFTAETIVTGNMNIYSGWDSTTYNLTFNVNGGDEASKPAVIQVPKNAVISEYLALQTIAIPTKTGHSFAGWAKNAEGTELTASDKMTTATTVYAKWNKKSYILNLDPNGGIRNTTYQKAVVYGTSIESAINNISTGSSNPTREWFTFTGWAVDTNGTAITDEIMPEGGFTLFAKWVETTPLEYSSTGLTSAHYGNNYLAELPVATDGSGDFTYSIVDEDGYALPSGITLSSNEGIPTLSGTSKDALKDYNFKVKAKDNNTGTERIVTFTLTLNKGTIQPITSDIKDDISTSINKIKGKADATDKTNSVIDYIKDKLTDNNIDYLDVTITTLNSTGTTNVNVTFDTTYYTTGSSSFDIYYEDVMPTMEWTTTSIPSIDATDNNNTDATILLDYLNTNDYLTVANNEIDNAIYESALGTAPTLVSAFTWDDESSDKTYTSWGDTYNFSKNYYGTTLTRQITVNVVNRSISIVGKTVTYSGETQYIDAATLGGEELIKPTATYTYYTNIDCDEETTIANGSASNGAAPKNAGTYYVKASVVNSGYYGENTSSKVTLVIDPKEITLEWNGYSGLIYGDSVNVTATAKASDLVNGDVCTVTVDNGNQIEAGSYIATATSLSNNNYKLPAVKTKDYSIDMATVTPSINGIQGKIYDGNVYVVNDTIVNKAGSDGTISYEFYADETCTEDSKLQNAPKDYGTYYVKAVLSETDNYYEVKSAAVEFTIEKKEISLIWNNTANRDYDGLASNVTATAGSLVVGDVCDVTVINGDNILAGTHTAEATDVSNTNYKLPTGKTKEYFIDKATENPSINGLTGKEYDGTAFAVSNTLIDTRGSLGTISYEFYTDAACTLEHKLTEAPKNVGDYYVKAIVTEDDNYYDMTSSPVLFTITQKEVGLVWAGYSNLTYNSNPVNVTATASGLILGDTCIVTVVNGNQVAAGPHIATATLLSNNNYKLPTVKTKEYEIAKATATPSINGIQGKTYDGNAYVVNDTIVNTAGSNGIIGYEFYTDAECTTANKLLGAPKDVGTYYVKAIVAEGDNYLQIISEPVSFTISAKEVTLNWSGTTAREYDGLASNVTATARELIGTDVCNVTVIDGNMIEAGTHTAEATLLSNANYKLPQNTLKNYVINRSTAAVAVILPLPDKTYDGTEYVIADNLVNVTGNTGEITYAYYSDEECQNAITGVPKNAGTYYVKATVAQDDNYESVTSAAKPFVINKKEISLLWSGDETRVYDELPSNVQATTGSLIEGDTCTATVADGNKVDAGTHTARVTALSNSNYKLPTVATNEYIIDKATFTLETVCDDIIYNGTRTPQPAITDNVSGGTVSYQYALYGTDDYSSTIPTAAGHYQVKTIVGETDNYEEMSTVDEFNINYAQTPESSIIIGNKDIDDIDDIDDEMWFNDKYTITPADGYKIATSISGPFDNELVISEVGADVGPEYIYLQDEDGNITDKIMLPTTNIDETQPKINGIVDKATYIGDGDKKVTILDANLKKVVVYYDDDTTGTNQVIGTNGKCEFTVAQTDKTRNVRIVVTDNSGNTTEYTIKVSPSTINTTQETFKIDGQVKDENNIPTPNAIVKLKKAKEVLKSTTSDENGNFTLTGMPNGIYIIEITYGDKIITGECIINGKNVKIENMILPIGIKNTEIELKSEDTPEIVVDGLNSLFSNETTNVDDKKGYTINDKTIVENGGKVTIKFEAEKKDEKIENGNVIKENAKNEKKTIGMFIDFSVIKLVLDVNSIEPTSTKIEELPELIKVTLEFDNSTKGRNNYILYRYHGSQVDKITTIANVDGEKIELLEDGSGMVAYLKKFSTYAIGYDETVTEVTTQPAKTADIIPIGTFTTSLILTLIAMISTSITYFIRKRKVNA